MKRLLIYILCALMAALLPYSALSEQAALQNAMELTVNGETIALTFDPNPGYTSLEGGYLHASYYAELDNALYELFMIFPADAQSGDVITPQGSMESGDQASGFLLFITEGDQDVTSLATQDTIGTFPAGSGYAITFDLVEDMGAATSYTGTLFGTLVDVDTTYNASGETHVLEGSFHFSTDLTKAVGEETRPALPLPDNAQKI